MTTITDRQMPMLSVIIPTLNEARYIEEVIQNIVKQDYPSNLIEVLFVDGGSNDSTRETIVTATTKYPRFRLIDNPRKIVPVAMNLAINEAVGDLIIRLDAHTSYPSDYLSKLVYWSELTRADNVGGICKTAVSEDTPVARAIASVFEDRLGVGNSRFRIGVREPCEVDTVPFGCYRRDVFEKVGRFNERLVRVQDYEFNQRLRRSGGKIYLVPDIVCTYYPRTTYRALWKNRFDTGKGIIIAPFITKNVSSISLRHIIPMLFILSIILPLVASLFFREAIFVSFFVIILYSSVVLIRSIKISNKQISWYSVFLAFTVLHVSYGFGSLVGVFHVIGMRLKIIRNGN